MSLTPSKEDSAFSAGYQQASEASGIVLDHLGSRLRVAEAQRSALVEVLSDVLNMLRAAHIQCGVHHDSNKRVVRAREVLAKVKAGEILP